MKKAKKAKSVKAWAIKNTQGEYYTNNNASREYLQGEMSCTDKIVRVQINEIPRRRGK